MKRSFHGKKSLCVLLVTALLGMAVLGGCADGTGESSEDNSSKESTAESTQPDSTESDGSEEADASGDSKETEGSTEAGSESESASGQAGDMYGGSIVVGVQQDIDSLDPHKATAAGTKEIIFNIFEGLVKPDENGNLINAVASDYTISEDGLTYTFTLRENVKFHNGNVVTAEDVKYSLERVSGLLDGTPLISTLKTIKSVDILDEKTVQVKVESANTELIYSFVAAIIPAGSGEDESADPIGTGPFSFVSYKPQEGIVLAKNPEYWQEGLPYLDQVEFKIINSADTALLELQGGTINLYAYLTDSQVQALQGSHQVISSASNVVQALFLNNAVEPLNDVRVRQAISYAVDKDAINDFVGGGNGTLISSAMLPTLKENYVDLNDTYGNAANVEKAKELLADAGFPDGFDLEITIPSNYEFHMQTGEVIVEQLKAVGINATIKAVEWATWLDEVYNGRQYAATISGITCDSTPGYLLNRFQTDSKKNFINFQNTEYDEIYAKAQAELDPAKKAEYYKELQKILCDEAGSVFLQVPASQTAISKNLAGYKFYPVYVQDMSTVYITE
ncbi:MAG: ABC transporter substrate-binding protein [Lachnospiraceae bacterium]|nr:ABC transporter substrate-binding protein [uncultured Acetatifactor sp.]MCI9218338.1 ABC transporter substrate-binding protein [Lachnospiraceae bacterium]